MPSVGDARLAILAASGFPAWLWTLDGTRVLWANPVGAQLFRARNATALAGKTFGPADPHRRQIAQLATRLRPEAAPRLERLRGFGAALGRLVTCACSLLVLADGRNAVLIAAAEAVGRPMPLTERLQRLVQDADVPMAAFGRDGVFVGASEAARALVGFRSLSDAGLDATRERALRDGRAETPVGVGHLVLQRVGSGADIGLVAMLEPAVLAALRPASPEAGKAAVAPSPEPESPPDDTPPADVSQPADVAESPDEEAEPHDEIPPRTQPLRFIWESDASGRFSIGSEELLKLIGPQSTAPLDGGTSLADAMATRAVWSGVGVKLPADGLAEGLPADLSGLPLFDANGFAGYRGFGMCHDLAAMTQLQTLRARESHSGHAPRSLSAQSTIAEPMFNFTNDPPEPSSEHENTHDSNETPDSWQEGPAVHPPEEAALNVVPFRPSNETASPSLTAVESSAFDELARELSARLDSDAPASADHEAATIPETEAAPDFAPLLDAVGDALLFVDKNGAIEFANRAAGDLFARDAEALKQMALADLFSPESAAQIATWLQSPKTSDRHELQTHHGEPLGATLVRAPGSSPCLVMRSLAVHRRQETEIATAHRDAARAIAEKGEILHRISEELRTPLTAIIGFADVMIAQRFGPLGNDRYVEYLKDIRGSGERVVAIVDDLLDLASIESGHRDLDFANQDLNDLVEQCVAAMQPQANRERIIIRSSLSHVLPPVVADGRTLRQIVVNLIGNSIQLANPGGQVIVSTTAQDGEVMLRLRDSGHGLNDNEVTNALAPFRSAEDNSEPAAIRLSLTRALIQANRARFQMRAAPYAGTLIEVAFPAS